MASFGSPTVDLTEKLHRRRDYRPNDAAAQPIKMGKIAAFWEFGRQHCPQNGRRAGHLWEDNVATVNTKSPLDLPVELGVEAEGRADFTGVTHGAAVGLLGTKLIHQQLPGFALVMQYL